MVNKEKVKFLKLLSGELLICEVLNHNTNLGASISNPLAIIMVPTKPGEKPSIALVPWVDFTKDKEFSIKGEHIIVIYNPTDDFVEEYCRKFSGIMTPPRQLILPG